MIVHSYEYYMALRAELEGLKDQVEKKSYINDVPFLKKGIYDEISFCNIALSNVKCSHCFQRKGTMKDDGFPVSGSSCSINGLFPESLNLFHHSCPNWVFEDVPQ